MKRRLESGGFFPPLDRNLLNAHTPRALLFIILAVLLLAGGLALLLLLKKWIADKPLKIAAVAILPALIISGVIGLEIFGRRYADNPDNIIWQAREMMHGRLNDTFGSGRGWVWRNALEVIPENPVFGTGPDTFFFALGDNLEYPRHLESQELLNQWFDKAHNIFLQIAVCMGIPALLAYLIFLGGVFIPAVKPAFGRPVLFAFGAAALSYTIQSFFAVEVPITTPVVWIALGVMAGEVWTAKIGCESTEV
jgi:O-antigen ligase